MGESSADQRPATVRRANQGTTPARDSVPRSLIVLVTSLFIAVIVVGGLLVVLGVESGEQDYRRVRIRVLKDQVAVRPDDVDSRRLLAFAYQQAGEDRDALHEYEVVLARDATDLASLYNTGVIHLSRGETEKGEQYLVKVLELSPTHTLAASTLGQLYLERGAYDRVVKVVLPAVTARKELADLHYLLGRGYAGSGDVIAARACYERALQRVPDMAEARAALDELEAGR